MNALILRDRFEFKNPRGKLGITGPAGAGKTQYALTLAAKLSKKLRVGLVVSEKYVLERLEELGANMRNILLGSLEADLLVIDDVQAFIEGVPKYKLARFLEGLKEPLLLISQIRLNDIPAIPLPRIRRHVVDERVEFDGARAYRRLLRRKIPLFEYEILESGFALVRRLSL